MLEQIFSTVYLNENKTVGWIFPTDDLLQKYDDFCFVFNPLMHNLPKWSDTP